MKTKKPIVLTAEIFAATLWIAALLQVLENVLPKIPLFPWLKFGLSYAIVLPFLERYGFKAAALLLVGRNAMGWLIAGQAFSSFLIGTLASTFAFITVGSLMEIALRRGFLGYMGVGVLLAATQNLSQLAAVEILFIHHRGYFFQIPPMLLWSVVSGSVTAWIGYKALPLLLEFWESPPCRPESMLKNDDPKSSRIRSRLFFVVSWIRLILVLSLPILRIQALLFTAATVILLNQKSIPMHKRLHPFQLLLTAWPLLLFQAWLHLFHGEGEFIAAGWITKQGLMAFSVHGLQLMNVILIGPRLQEMIPFNTLKRSQSPYLRGMVLAWQGFPEIINQFRQVPNRMAILKNVFRGDFSLVFKILKAEKN